MNDDKGKEINEVLSRMGNEVVSLIATSRNLGENYAKLVELLGVPPGNGHGEYKENAGYRDRLILEHFDKNGKLIAKRDSGWGEHKCLTNTGFAEVSGLFLTDVGGTDFDFIGIGTGVVAADPTDTDLGGEEARKAGTGTQQTEDVADDTSQLVASFAAADGLAGVDAITESGVLNGAAPGVHPAVVMVCRQVFAALNINWDTGDTLQVTWRVQAKQGA
ncbi:hypothetical protein ES705_13354 [subsurface metagenome]